MKSYWIIYRKTLIHILPTICMKSTAPLLNHSQWILIYVNHESEKRQKNQKKLLLLHIYTNVALIL
ncbi:hypothetical protein A9G06_15630 [Aeromonas sp. DNP9]|nr:hypothetical protein A9G06_15630 [Aeromonas sp. DNP9]